MTTGDRIKARRKELGLSVDELADKLGKNRATIYRYEGNYIENLPTPILEPIAKALDTTPAYLMGWGKHETEKKQTNVIKIPVLGYVRAGIPMSAVEEILDYEEVPASYGSADEIFGLRVSGDSMEPKFSDGDVIICRKQDDVDSGTIGVVLVNGNDAAVKKIVKNPQGISLVSNNPSYSPMFYTNEECATLPVTIIGKVIELRAKFI